MARVVFFEKPGCINNTRQKQLLREAGFDLEVHDMLTTAWNVERLRPFFAGLPLAEWFNASAPRIKSGEVVPEALDTEAALLAMVGDPLLIRRPLMELDGRLMVGFDAERLGLVPPETDLENCPRSHTATTCEPGGTQ